jgi:hypothetical protein
MCLQNIINNWKLIYTVKSYIDVFIDNSVWLQHRWSYVKLIIMTHDCTFWCQIFSNEFILQAEQYHS